MDTLTAQHAALDKVRSLEPFTPAWHTAAADWHVALAAHYEYLATLPENERRIPKLLGDAAGLRRDAAAQRQHGMQERTIIIPEQDNEHKPLRYESHVIRQALLDIAGGYTSDSVVGAWRGDNGGTFYDKSERLTLAVTPEQDAAIVARLPEWCKLLRQQALYTSVRPIDVTFVTTVTETSVA